MKRYIRAKNKAGDDHDIVARLVVSENGIAQIWDWSSGELTKADYARYFIPVDEGSDINQVRRLNIISHAKYLSPETALHGPRWRGSKAGRTCVIVAPGPSATRIDERLTPYRGKVDVIACNLASKMVDMPEFYSVLDRNDLAGLKWCDGLDPSKSVLLTHPAASYSPLTVWQAEPRNTCYYWLVEDAGPEEEIYKDLGVLSAGRHVGVTTIHAACVLGYTTILLVGFDFTKPVGGAYYADNHEDMNNVEERGWSVIAGIGGKELVSGRFILDAIAMEAACDIARCDGRRIVNCAGRGILFGVQQGVLEDELAKL
jgi:hypothetical protein